MRVIFTDYKLLLWVFLAVSLIALVRFAVRRRKKTSKAVSGGLWRLGLQIPGMKKPDTDVSADGQMAAQADIAEPSETPMAAEPEVMDKRRGFGLPALSLLRRKAESVEGPNISAASETMLASEPKDAKSGPKFKFPLPFSRKAKDQTDMPAKAVSVSKAPRTDEDFQSATLGKTDAEDEKLGLGKKIQLFVARLTTAERKPKAFADRPDPFDKLAFEVRQS